MNIQGGGGDRAHEATTILAREAYTRGGRPERSTRNRFGKGCGRGSRRSCTSPAARRDRRARRSGGRGARRTRRSGRHGSAAGTCACPHRGTGGGCGAPRAHQHGGVRRAASAAPTPRSAATRTAITSARARAGCRHPGHPAVAAAAAGSGGAAYQLMDSTHPGPDGQGRNVAVRRRRHQPGRHRPVRRRRNRPPTLTAGLSAIVAQAVNAQKAFDSGNDAATAAPIEAGLAAVRALRSQLGVDGSAAMRRATRSTSASSPEGARLSGRRDCRPRPHLRSGRRRRPGHRRAAGQGVAGGDQPRAAATWTSRRWTWPASTAQPPAPPGRPRRTPVYSCAADLQVGPQAKLTEPYYHDDYWKHPESPARNTFDPGVPFGMPSRRRRFASRYHVKAGSVDVTKEFRCSSATSRTSTTATSGWS